MVGLYFEKGESYTSMLLSEHLLVLEIPLKGQIDEKIKFWCMNIWSFFHIASDTEGIEIITFLVVHAEIAYME